MSSRTNVHKSTGATGTTGAHRVRQTPQSGGAPNGSPIVRDPKRTTTGDAGSPGAREDNAASTASPQPIPSMPAMASLPTLSPSSLRRPWHESQAMESTLSQASSELSPTTVEESSSVSEAVGGLALAWTSSTGDLRQDHMSLNELANRLAGLHGCGPGMAGAGRTLVLTSGAGDANKMRRLAEVVPQLDFLSGVSVETHLPLVDFGWVHALFTLNQNLSRLEVRTGAGKDLLPFIQSMASFAAFKDHALAIKHIRLAVTPAPPRNELVMMAKALLKHCPELETLDLSALNLESDAVAALRSTLNEVGKDGMLHV